MCIKCVAETVKQEIKKTPKLDDGSITRENGIKILQRVFKNTNSFTAMKTCDTKTDVAGNTSLFALTNKPKDFGFGYGYGYGFGFGGILSEVKDLFDLYMDKDSEDGELITKKEQDEIKKTVDNWQKAFMELVPNIKK